MKFLTQMGVIVLLGAAAPANATTPDRSGLAWAYRFASAITPDPVDQAKAQEQVLRDYLAGGDLSAVAARVEQIPNWRRGVIYAELAGAYWQQGQTNAAARAVAAAKLVQDSYRGDWQSQRLAMHLARAHVLAGDAVTAPGNGLSPEESAQVDAARAQGTATAGNARAALQQLDLLAGAQNFDAQSAALDGYLAVAGVGSPEERRLALEGAERVLAHLPLVKRLALVPVVAERYLEGGWTNATRRVLVAHDSVLAAATVEPVYLAPSAARTALVWLRLGERDTGQRWLRRARAVALTGNPLEQPTASAGVVDALVAAGEVPAAWELYERGLAVAAGFVNARPRAQAIADLCRALGRAGLPVSGARADELAGLLAGLQDPW